MRNVWLAWSLLVAADVGQGLPEDGIRGALQGPVRESTGPRTATRGWPFPGAAGGAPRRTSSLPMPVPRSRDPVRGRSETAAASLVAEPGSDAARFTYPAAMAPDPMLTSRPGALAVGARRELPPAGARGHAPSRGRSR
jgi:hypothetical protein